MTQISHTFKLFLARAFDIREGEISRALLMQGFIFLLISTLLIIKPTVTSLFLSNVGVEKLPLAFMLLAVVAAIISSFYSRILNSVSLERIIIRTLQISVLTILVFRVLLGMNYLEGWVLYLFYIWMAIFGVFSASQFWILANIVFNNREAKRLFGFIGAGAIAGGIFGGYLTTLLAQAISSENLLFVCIFFLLICIPIVRHLWKHHVEETQNQFQQKKRLKGISNHPVQIIRKSRHLMLLASIIGVSVIVSKIVDYQFNAIASDAIPDEDNLTAFLGFWFSTMNVISLLVQLFVTRRVVGVFGVGFSMFFLPVGILTGALVLLFIPGLWAAVLLKVNDGSLKQSINKSAIELLALPIPNEIKNQTKTFIDVFVDSLASGIAGLILIFLVNGMELSTRFISLIIIALIGFWIYLAFKVRREYLHTFKLRMNEATSGKAVKPIPDLNQESVLGGFRKVLENGGQSQRIWILRKIRELSDPRMFEPVKALLSDPDPELKVEVIRTLYFYRHHSLVREILPLIHHPEQSVKITAFDYLIAHTHNEDLEATLGAFLEDSDPVVKAAALVSLAGEAKDNEKFKTFFNLEGRILDLMDEIEKSKDGKLVEALKISLAKAIGEARMEKFLPELYALFEDDNPQVARAAIVSAGRTENPQLIPVLLQILPREVHRETVLTTLGGFGQEIIPVIHQLAFEPSTTVELCRQLPAIAGKIDHPGSVDFLFHMLDFEDHVVRSNALRALNELKASFPHLNFPQKDILDKIVEEAKLYLDILMVFYAQNQLHPDSITPQNAKIKEAREGLMDLLERRLDGNLERIFRLLGLKYPPQDMLFIYNGIQSKKPSLRENGIEFLDNLLEPGLKRLLMPILETALLDTISADAIRKLKLDVPDEYQCFRLLLEGKDNSLKLSVLYLISQLQEKRFLPLVHPIINHPNTRVRDYALMAMHAIEGEEE